MSQGLEDSFPSVLLPPLVRRLVLGVSTLLLREQDRARCLGSPLAGSAATHSVAQALRTGWDPAFLRTHWAAILGTTALWCVCTRVQHMCICISVHIHVLVCTRVCACVSACSAAHVCLQVLPCVCIKWTRVHVCACECVSASACGCACVSMRVCACVYLCVRACVHFPLPRLGAAGQRLASWGRPGWTLSLSPVLKSHRARLPVFRLPAAGPKPDPEGDEAVFLFTGPGGRTQASS